MNPRVKKLIIQAARRHGVDPNVALSVASVEGGIKFGAVGDGGHAFGPFQMNDAGGVLTGRKGDHAAFANSPAGIDEAMRGIAKYAAGKTGRAGIAAAVRGYERPANPGAEIERAMASLQGGHGTLASGLGGAQGGNGAALGGSGGASGTLKQQLAQLLLGAAQNGGQFAPGGLMALAQARHQQDAAVDTFGTEPAAGSLVHAAASGGGINELFYDPLGGIKRGKQIGAIGGHSDHVHVSMGTLGAQQRALAEARKLGLRVGEDGVSGKVNPVHVETSNHYKTYNNKSALRQAADISGDPRAMATFYKWVQGTFG